MRDNMTLLHIAKSDMRMADRALKSLTGDECELNQAAYHLQQALEKTMKHILEINGIQPKYTHDLEDIYNHHKEHFCDMSEPLVDRLVKITTWESKTRYVKGYRTERDSVMKVFYLVEDYIYVVDRYATGVQSTREFL